LTSTPAPLRPINISAVVNRKNMHNTLVIIDTVDYAEVTPTRRVFADEI
jgi:hypothetical protein